MVSTHEGGAGYPKRLLFVDGLPIIKLSPLRHKGEKPGQRLRSHARVRASAVLAGDLVVCDGA